MIQFKFVVLQRKEMLDGAGLTSLAEKLWLNTNAQHQPESIIDTLFNQLNPDLHSQWAQQLIHLNLLQSVIWTYFEQLTSPADCHRNTALMALILLNQQNGKQRINVNRQTMEKLLHALVQLVPKVFPELSESLQTQVCVFISNCFSKFHHPVILSFCDSMTGLEICKNTDPQFLKRYSSVSRDDTDSIMAGDSLKPCDLLLYLVSQLPVVASNQSQYPIQTVAWILQIFIDIQSQNRFRRFFNLMFKRSHTLSLLKLSFLHAESIIRFLLHRLCVLTFKESVNLNQDMQLQDELRLQTLQRIAFKVNKGAFAELCVATPSMFTAANLQKYLHHVQLADLEKVLVSLALWSLQEDYFQSKELLVQIVCDFYGVEHDENAVVRKYPSYNDLFLEDDDAETQSLPLKMSRLYSNYLSTKEFIMISSKVVQSITFKKLSQLIESYIADVRPFVSQSGTTQVETFSTHCVGANPIQIIQVHKSEFHSTKSFVLAEIAVNLSSLSSSDLYPWNILRPHDVLFLLNVRATSGNLFEIPLIQGCEIVEIRNQTGESINFNLYDRDEENINISPIRHYVVKFDFSATGREPEIVSDFSSLNFMLRIDAERSSFKSTLQNLQDLIVSSKVSQLPQWLVDAIIGSESGPQYQIPSSLFVQDCFEVNFGSLFGQFEQFEKFFESLHIDSCVLTPETKETGAKLSRETDIIVSFPSSVKLFAESNTDMKKKTSISVRFTEARIYSQGPPFPNRYLRAAFRSLFHGITLVRHSREHSTQTISDLLLHMIRLWGKNNCKGRTLLITRTNKSLNEICEYLLSVGFPEGRIVRAGHGEKQMKDVRDFSRNGRAEYLLQRRLELLVQVKDIAMAYEMKKNNQNNEDATQVAQGACYSCEAAEQYFKLRIERDWLDYLNSLNDQTTQDQIISSFPFGSLFPQVLNKAMDIQTLKKTAEQCFSNIQDVFSALRDLRPLEVLRKKSERGKFVMTHYAHIVAMTSTYSTMSLSNLIKDGFTFDNIILIEAGMMLEIESLIPCFTQRNMGSLQRLVVFGNEDDSPQDLSEAMRHFGNYGQTFFHRLQRAGFPVFDL